MKKQNIVNLIIVLVALSPLGYLFIVWNNIPESFVTRFEFNKAFEKVQSRNTLFLAVSVLALVSVLLYFLMRNLKKIDPKVKEGTETSSFNKLGLIITVYLVVLNYFFILSTKNGWKIDTKVSMVFFGLLVMFMGNYMNNIKPNYFAGFRLPWTLNDPDNWRRTHQLAGKLWFVAGILLVIISFLISKAMVIPISIGILIVIVIIPAVYSFKVYRDKLN
jgi:immunity protein, SdpI family